MSWWSRFDRFLSKVETKGFHFANKAHVYTINAILVGLAYGTYTLFRDYNEFFKAGRDPNYGRDLDELEDEQLGESAHPSGATGRDRL